MKIKTKRNKWVLIKCFLTAKKQTNKQTKTNHKQNEKTTHRMGENTGKRNNHQGTDLQNIQTAHAAQYQKNKQLNQKIGRRSKYLFPPRRHSRRHSFPPRKTYFP